jgi:hypothetical protein
MLKSDSSIRFTTVEVDELAELGIDVAGAKSADDFAAALEPWLDALAEARPDLIRKIAEECVARRRIRRSTEER